MKRRWIRTVTRVRNGRLKRSNILSREKTVYWSAFLRCWKVGIRKRTTRKIVFDICSREYFRVWNMWKTRLQHKMFIRQHPKSGKVCQSSQLPPIVRNKPGFFLHPMAVGMCACCLRRLTDVCHVCFSPLPRDRGLCTLEHVSSRLTLRILSM